LSLEELGDLEVTSVSGRAEPLSSAAASIYVITRDDIRRAGVTSLPEALRLAPNLLVARADAVQYAISARGFNSLIANKLLVLIDGRTVYTPLFSGVYWDMQDVVLEDVERIEVISGPGATLWGANAVNGVINITTRSAADTQGSMAVVGAGNREAGGTFRFGGRVGTGHFRAYVKATDLDNTERANGVDVPDAWTRAQLGMRADWPLAAGSLTLQGDAYAGQSAQRGAPPPTGFGRVEIAGANVLGRWTRNFDGGSDLQVQAYLDYTDREDFGLFSPEAAIFDIDVRHSIPLGKHELLWGGGYRDANDDVKNGLFFGFAPPQRDLHWANLFAQTAWNLTERLALTVGLKLEDNDYTGTESLPNVRIAWTASPTQFVWSGLSRAVRAPARLDRDVLLPPPTGFIIRGGPDFVSEVAEVIEVGYRADFERGLGISATAFHYDWDKLRSGQPPPAFIQNMIEGSVYGFEAWATWRTSDRWSVSAGLMSLEHDLGLKPGSTDPTGPSALGNDPEHQWMLRSTHAFGLHQQLDVMVRRVDELPQPAVPAYTAVDINYSWHFKNDFALSIAAQNVFDGSHPESGAAPNRSEFPRGAYLKLRWSPF
jgi:iron complex outermembrane receptor protein